MKDTQTKNQINSSDDRSYKHITGNQLFANHYLIEHFNPLGIDAFYHTYPVAIDREGKRHAWNALGGDTGGTQLMDTDTTTKDGIDISTIDYIMTKEPCIWPMEYYAVVGVCWNATNRGLYFTHKTVHNVKFYSVVEFYLGTYGLDDDSTCFRKKCKEGRKLYSWSKARKAINKNCPWHGKVIADAEMAKSNNSRIKLYHQYFGETALVANKRSSPEDRWFNYLQDLVRLNMKEKIEGVDENKINKALELHKKRYEARSLTGLESNVTIDSRIETENHLNNVLNDFKELLDDKEYEQLFNAQKHELFTLQM